MVGPNGPRTLINETNNIQPKNVLFSLYCLLLKMILEFRNRRTQPDGDVVGVVDRAGVDSFVVRFSNEEFACRDLNRHRWLLVFSVFLSCFDKHFICYFG